MLSIIVAVAKNNVIGKDNKLIWHLPEDLKRFKKLTTGHNIIMGRKTFESLGRVLPNRKHIVLCNDMNLNIEDENVRVIDGIDKLKDKIKNISLMDESSKRFNKNLVIVPSYLSKGLEFDSVISYTDKDNVYTKDERDLFYVVTTRCQHELIIYNPPKNLS